MKGFVMGTPDNTADTSTQDVDWKAEAEKAEKRRRDTQAAYTKSQQELAQLKATVAVLERTAKPQVDQAKLAELEDLKFSDPDAWRVKVNSLEAEVQKQHEAEIATAAKNLSDYEIRQATLEEFKATHPGFELSDDDIPPRIAKKLAEGKVSFEEFLEEVHSYLTAPRVVGETAKTLEQPNLSKVGGGNTPSQAAKSEDIILSYRKEIF